MFIFDCETGGKTTNSVILSMACIFFDARKKPGPEELRDTAFFAKFSVKDQVERFGRGFTRSSLDWWGKQCDIVKAKSFRPDPVSDIPIDVGIEMMRDWSKQFENHDKCWVWARGNLDQLVLDAMEETLAIPPVFFYNRWRDVRTAVDLMTGSTSGYCKVEYDDFDPAHHIMKHDPIDDCVYDAMMLMYGVNE